MFKDIHVGMTRAAAEEILGRPMAADVARGGIVEAWYLAPPVAKRPHPKGGPGSIYVAYRAGKVVDKRLHPLL